MNCLLCDRTLASTSSPHLFIHDPAEDCLVRVTDGHGISLDHKFGIEQIDGVDEIVYLTPPPEPEPEYAEDGEAVDIVQFYLIERALPRLFEEHGLERLGGRSTGSGWSNVSLFQKCPHAWKRRYLDNAEVNHFGIVVEDVPRGVGSLVHTYLAVYYMRMIVHDYPLTPDTINVRLREWGCNPKIYEEAWRLFTGYALFYQHEDIQPLAIEYNLRDPRTNDSCRYDLIAFFPKDRPGMLAGTYGIEHKTAARFDSNTLDGWSGDGEVLGQVLHWERLHLDRKFGPLKGVMVNILGKQKTPEFHRTIVSPTTFTIEQHRSDLRNWNGKIAVAKAINDFPRSRNNCIRGFSRCEHWDHCNSGE